MVFSGLVKQIAKEEGGRWKVLKREFRDGSMILEVERERLFILYNPCSRREISLYTSPFL